MPNDNPLTNPGSPSSGITMKSSFDEPTTTSKTGSGTESSPGLNLTDEQVRRLELEFARKHGLVDAQGFPFDPTTCWIDRAKQLRRDHVFQWLWKSRPDGSEEWSNVAQCACGYQRIMSRADMDGYKNRHRNVPWPASGFERPAEDIARDLQANIATPLTAQEREVLRQSIKDSITPVAPGRLHRPEGQQGN